MQRCSSISASARPRQTCRKCVCTFRGSAAIPASAWRKSSSSTPASSILPSTRPDSGGPADTQAEAKKFFVEKMRMGKWERTGIFWWNLLDGWPQFSDAIVDYYFDKKLAYDHIKRAQQDVVLCMSEIEGWQSALIVANDTFTAHAGTYTVTDGETGEVVAEGVFRVGANESRQVGSVPVFYSEKRLVLLRLDFDGRTVWNHHIFGEVPFDLARARRWQEIIGALPW